MTILDLTRGLRRFISGGLANGVRATSLATVMAIALLSACGGGESPSSSERSPSLLFSINFDTNVTDWRYGYSDYSPDHDPGDVVVQPRSAPQPFTGFGLYSFGTNLSDDLFIYAKKQFSGFKPNTSYALKFDVTFLTNAPTGCAGVGGGGGDAVVLKAGASAVEPITVWRGDSYRMNVDIGRQMVAGKDAVILGTIAGTNSECAKLFYESKTLASTASITATSDSNGSLWILFGTDSGFEYASHIYYRSAVVTAQPVSN